MSAPSYAPRPQTDKAIALAVAIRDFDLKTMRAEIEAFRQRMRDLGWPDPCVAADWDAKLCRVLTECRQIVLQLLDAPSRSDERPARRT